MAAKSPDYREVDLQSRAPIRETPGSRRFFMPSAMPGLRGQDFVTCLFKLCAVAGQWRCFDSSSALRP
jgi:hypothetical protein